MKLTPRNFPIVQVMMALLLFGTISTSQAQSFLTNGLVAYYPFNVNANDESGFARHGTAYGATLATDRFNVPNAAFEFDGNDDYLGFIDSGALPHARAPFTLTMWVYLDPQFATVEHRFIITVGGTPLEQWQFFQGSRGDMSLEFYTGTTQVGGTTGLQWKFNKWYHLALVRRAASEGPDTVVWYRDGVQIGSHQTTAGDFDSNEQTGFTIGRRLNGYGPWFGKLDDFRIYDRDLSASEIQQLYEAEKPAVVNIRKAVSLEFSGLKMGSNYQLQISPALNTWTNAGTPFPATNTTIRSTQYWDVDEWSERYFRLQILP